MHPAAKASVLWAVALFVVGTVLLMVLPDAFAWLPRGTGADVVLDAANLVLNLVRMTTFPVGAALVGAAVVIQALSGPDRR